MSQQINLFNPVFMSQRKYFSVVAMLQALVLIALGSGLFYGYASYQIKSLTVQIDESNKRYAVEQGKVSHYSAGLPLQDSGESLENELKSIEAKLAAQHDIIETLKGGNAAGYSEYMRAFARQRVNGLWLSSFHITGDATQMNISGSVLSPESLGTYMRKLNQEPVMRGKSFASLQMQRGGNEGRSVEFMLQSGDVGRAVK